MSDLQDDDHQSAFDGLLAPSLENAKKRLTQERKAGRTPKQRARRAKRTEPMSFRVAPDCKALLDALASSRECSQADVLHELVYAAAKREKIVGGSDA